MKQPINTKSQNMISGFGAGTTGTSLNKPSSPYPYDIIYQTKFSSEKLNEKERIFLSECIYEINQDKLYFSPKCNDSLNVISILFKINSFSLIINLTSQHNDKIIGRFIYTDCSFINIKDIIKFSFGGFYNNEKLKLIFEYDNLKYIDIPNIKSYERSKKLENLLK